MKNFKDYLKLDLKLHLKMHGGFTVFLLLSLLGIIRVLRQSVPGHYRIFTGAARALWNFESPHGTDFGTGVGYWFYSPSCGLYFFKFFELFPEKLGLSIYSALSIFLLAFGINRFLTVLKKDDTVPVFKIRSLLIKNTIYLLISPMVLLGVTNSKPEIIMTGILFLGSSLLLQRRNEGVEKFTENKRIIVASLLLSMILVWKYQPLPSLGLLSLAWIFTKRTFKFPALLFFFTLFWIVSPLIILPFSLVTQIYSDLTNTFSTFISAAWMNFDSIFTFIVHGLHVDLSYSMTQPLSAFIAAALVFGIYRLRMKSFAELTLYSLCFGALFTATLSPLSQNNSYAILFPFLLGNVAIMVDTENRPGTIVKTGFIILILILFFGYSDIMPKNLKGEVRKLGLKPVALFIFGIVLFVNRLKLPRRSVVQL